LDYHTDYEVKLITDTVHSGLYKWCLQEFDSDGEQVGRDLIPWGWSLAFDATNLRYSFGLKHEGADRYRLAKLEQAVVDEDRAPLDFQVSEVIGATLVPAEGRHGRTSYSTNIAHIKNPVKNPSASALACAREASPPPANSNEGLEASRLTVVQRLGGQAVVDAWRGRHGIGLYLWQNIADNLAGAHGLYDPIPTNAVATAARQTTDAMNAYFEMTIRDLDREGRLSEIEGIVSEHDLACFKSYGTIEIEGEDQDRLLERLHELGRL
jgi:hypothetical protein